MTRLFLALTVLVACGNQPATSDGRVDVQTDDADTTDAPLPGLVSVTVYDWGSPAAPMPNQSVVFQNADGSVVSITMTDQQGTASATMLPGGSVTAVRTPRPGFSSDTLYTFMAVEPGDQLVVGSPPPTTPTTFTVSFKLPTFSNVNDYEVVTKCGLGFAAPIAMPVAQATLSCSPVDVYVRARDSSVNNYTLGAFYKPAIAVTANATIDLTAETYLAPTTVPVTMTNLPSFVNNGFVEVGLFDGNFLLETRINAAITDGELDTSVVLPPISGVQLYVFADLQHISSSYGGSPSFVQEVRHLVPFTGLYNVDASTLVIPWVPYYALVDPISQRVYWTEDPGGTAADFVRVDFDISYSSNNMFFSFVRKVAGPHVEGELKLTMLPPPLDKYNFTPDHINGSSLFYIVRAPGGWNAVRPTAFEFYPSIDQVGQSSVGSAPDNLVVYEP